MPTLSKLAKGEVLCSTARPADLPLDELPSKPSPQPSEGEAKPPGGAAADLTALEVKISPIIARSDGAKLKLDTTSDASLKESTPKRVTPSNIAVEGAKPKRVTVTVAKTRRDMALGLKVGSFKGPSGVEVRVDRILPGSVFEKTALEEGMIIESVDGERYDSFLDCIALLKQAVCYLTLGAVAPTNKAEAPLDSDKENAPPTVAAAAKRKSDAAGQNEPIVKKSVPPKSELELKTLAEVLADPAAVIVQGADKWTVERSRGTLIFQDELKKMALESLDDASRGCNERLVKPLRDLLSAQLGTAPRYHTRGRSDWYYRLMVDDEAISQAIRAKVKSVRYSERRRIKRARAASAPLPAPQASTSAFQANASAITTRPYFEETMPPSMLLPALFHLAKQESDATLVVAAKKALAGRKKKQLKGVGASTSMQAARLQEEMQSKPATNRMAVVLKTETIALDCSMG